MGASSRVPAAAQVLAVLRALASAPGPTSAVALARTLGLPRSTTYHLLTVLARDGFVVHLPEEHRWGLGVAAFEVGSAYLRHDPLERLARPLLTRLVDEVAVVAPTVGQVGVLHGRETLYLLRESPRRPVTVVTDVGVRLPAQLTASGRSLLAGLPAAQVRALFPSAAAFVDRTGRGPRTLAELRRVLSVERSRGWSVEDGEVSEGYASVAAAAHDHAGRPVAAFALTFRRETCPPELWPSLADAARAAAATLSRRLGGRDVGGAP
ncbi:MAG TPA: IclR family transcriptional regulator [Actinomycetes bacterium]|nr:IclR family transcriptional regulator [Actinomycetes bacterium]